MRTHLDLFSGIGGFALAARWNGLETIGFVKDMEKYNEAAALGWRVLRCQPKDVCTMEFVATVKRALT